MYSFVVWCVLSIFWNKTVSECQKKKLQVKPLSNIQGEGRREKGRKGEKEIGRIGKIEDIGGSEG